MGLSVIHFFHVLMFVDVTLAALCAYLIIRLPLRYGVKFITIPLVIFSTFLMVILGSDILGRPYQVYPRGEFEFLDYRVVQVDGKKEIELWAIQHKKSRLHLIPYTEKTEQELAKAASRARNGGRQMGQFGGPLQDGNGMPNGHEGNELNMREVPRALLLPPKAGDESASAPQQSNKSPNVDEEDVESIKDKVKRFFKI